MIGTQTFSPPPIDRGEIVRYARADGKDRETGRLIEECIDEIRDRLCYRVCFSRFPITRNKDTVSFAGGTLSSGTLSAALSGCDELLLFAATIGVEPDRAIARCGLLSPAKALMFQGLGAERIESLCNTFMASYQQSLEQEGLFLKPRVSPGYGDIPLSFQKFVFSVLDCPRKIGLTLNESLMMSPAKSVTAIAGITRECPLPQSDCGDCGKTNCDYRKGRGNS